MDGPLATNSAPLVSICIPHWQVQSLMEVCLRSIRRHTRGLAVELLVVDNGSRDASLDWLRSLSWIRLLERPEETPDNWPNNVFTAWDLGARAAQGRFYLTMHSDVLVTRDGWLAPFLREMERDSQVAAAGAWKLELEHPLYRWQKDVLGGTWSALKSLLGRRGRSDRHAGRYPRDYCALYRRDVVVENDLTFCPEPGEITGGHAIARQLWAHGYKTALFPVGEMARSVVHVAHATAAISTGPRLKHARSQRRAERRARNLLASPWVEELRRSDHLDAA